MSNFLIWIARIIEYYKLTAVLVVVAFFSGFGLFYSIADIFFSFPFKNMLYGFKENLAILASLFTLFIITGLPLWINSKFYKEFVIVKNKFYTPIVKEVSYETVTHYPKYVSKCETCTFDSKCTAHSKFISECNFYQKYIDYSEPNSKFNPSDNSNSIKDYRKITVFKKILTAIKKAIKVTLKWLIILTVLGFLGLGVSALMLVMGFNDSEYGQLMGISMLTVGTTIAVEILLGVIYLIIKYLFNVSSED